MASGTRKSAAKIGILVLGLVLISGCGIGGASITAHPSAGRNVHPTDTQGELPVTGDSDQNTPNDPGHPPAPFPRPPRDPAPVFETKTARAYTVDAEVLRVSPVGGSRRKLKLTLDAQIFESVQTNETARVYVDETDFLTGFATVRNSMPGGLKPTRFVLRLERDTQGVESLFFSEASAKRLMRALLPDEFARGELDLRAEGGLVLARFALNQEAGEVAIGAGGVALPLAFLASGAPWVAFMGIPTLAAAQMSGVCNGVHAGNIRMLSRDLMWRSWSSPNLVEHPECR